MTAVQTLREPKAERPIDKLDIKNMSDADWEALKERERWRLAIDERDILEGQSVEPPLSLQEIVAICKEVRAEMYEEEQARKNSVGG